MELTEMTVQGYVALVSGPEVDPGERALQVQERLKSDDTYRRRVFVGTRGEAVVAAASAHPWIATQWQAVVRATDAAVLQRLVPEWLDSVQSLPRPPQQLVTRVDVSDDVVNAVLAGAGWERRGERFEFRTPVPELPAERFDTMLHWRRLEEVGVDHAAQIFEAAGQGPDWEDGDDGRALIDEYLSDDSVRTSIEIGWRGETPVAFIAAQCEPESGWCTLVFLGVVPDARRTGLGIDVHRHGFSMLRRLGGTDYHGGTSAENVAMRRLFEQNGCRPYRHLREWSVRLA